MSRTARTLRALLFLALVPVLGWTALAILFVGGGPEGVGMLRWGALALAAGIVLAGLWLPPRLRALPALAVFALLVGIYFSLRPSNDRAWTEDHSRPPRIDRVGDVVTVRDVRDFRHRPDGGWTAAWYDASYDLRELRAAWFAVEYFASAEAVAHTFVSFQFGEDDYLTVSVEIRREQDESYSPLRGLFRQFELIYVFGDERDILDLRAGVRGNPVYLHPIDAPQPALVAFFEDVVERAGELAERPAFYNTATASCATTLSSHLDRVSDRRTRLDWRVYVPGYSGQLAWEEGLIQGDLSWELTRARDLITPRMESAVRSADFSRALRGLD